MGFHYRRLSNHFLALGRRCGQPGQQHGLRLPPASSSTARSIRRRRVASCLAEITQQIHSLRASGVRSFQVARAVVDWRTALLKSAGLLCTGSGLIACFATASSLIVAYNSSRAKGESTGIRRWAAGNRGSGGEDRGRPSTYTVSAANVLGVSKPTRRRGRCVPRPEVGMLASERVEPHWIRCPIRAMSRLHKMSVTFPVTSFADRLFSSGVSKSRLSAATSIRASFGAGPAITDLTRRT